MISLSGVGHKWERGGNQSREYSSRGHRSVKAKGGASVNLSSREPKEPHQIPTLLHSGGRVPAAYFSPSLLCLGEYMNVIVFARTKVLCFTTRYVPQGTRQYTPDPRLRQAPELVLTRMRVRLSVHRPVAFSESSGEGGRGKGGVNTRVSND